MTWHWLCPSRNCPSRIKARAGVAEVAWVGRAHFLGLTFGELEFEIYEEGREAFEPRPTTLPPLTTTTTPPTNPPPPPTLAGSRLSLLLDVFVDCESDGEFFDCDTVSPPFVAAAQIRKRVRCVCLRHPHPRCMMHGHVAHHWN